MQPGSASARRTVLRLAAAVLAAAVLAVGAGTAGVLVVPDAWLHGPAHGGSAALAFRIAFVCVGLVTLGSAIVFRFLDAVPPRPAPQAATS